jgi:protein-L-isoaspartate(D-aspartate) O-methyltransferase
MSSDFSRMRESMVETQLRRRDILDEKVLGAMLKVPRHLFVPQDMRRHAYNDEPLPIGEGQTISQPYIVAYMTQALRPQAHHRILEVGTGSGYQTAILAELAQEVFTVELLPSLSRRAVHILGELGYTNIRFKVADGTLGWEEHAPYEGIIVTAAPGKVPKTLQAQLDMSARLVIPVGVAFQDLVLVTRRKNRFVKKKLLPVRFVPLIRPT